MKAPQYDSVVMVRGLSGTFNWAVMMSRDASLSGSSNTSGSVEANLQTFIWKETKATISKIEFFLSVSVDKPKLPFLK